MVQDEKKSMIAFQNLTIDLNKNLKQFLSCIENLSLYFNKSKKENLDFRKVNSFNLDLI